MEDNITLKRLKEEMRIKNITAYKIAKETGIKKQSVYNWINGKQEPTISNFAKICKFLEVSADYLLDIKDY